MGYVSLLGTENKSDDKFISGMIIIWSGSINNIPEGWVLCNGENNTPDLRDRFVLGAGSSYTVGTTGGEETHTLTINEMPSHNHTQSTITGLSMLNINGSGSNVYERSQYVYSANNGSRNYYTTYKYSYLFASSGNDSAHNNMPPYYALCYIMKV